MRFEESDVKPKQYPLGILSGAAIALLASPVQAAQVQVTGVEVKPSGEGIQVRLQTTGQQRQQAQIFAVQRDKAYIADILDTQLQLGSRNSYSQQRPSPGIASVDIQQLDPNSVRVTIVGESDAPEGSVILQENANIILGVVPSSGATGSNIASPPPLIAQMPPTGTAPTPSTSGNTNPNFPTPAPEVIFPNPNITIEGQPVPASAGNLLQPIAPTPPFLPRAVAPPVGDIAVSNIDTSTSYLDLGSSAVVPRLVLREAPVKEVLSLLARAAGLNVVFVDNPATTISLDLENEPVQDVFNSVLLVSDLDASRRGRTIYIGSDLPDSASNRVARTYRLNQALVNDAKTYLTSAIPLTGEGLDVLVDERLNSITLVGEPRQVAIATTLLTQMDVRKRQVALNVKIVDVNLLETDEINSSVSFSVAGGFIAADNQGVVIRAREFNPATTQELAFNNAPVASAFNYPKLLLARIQAEITNGAGKILTDPTMVVQEGEEAVIDFSEEIYAGEEIEQIFDDNQRLVSTISVPIIENVGLILNIRVDRIDDNGFVTMQIAPEVSTIGGTAQSASSGTITLKNVRKLDSGVVRIRDSQTLILAGIIQEQDITNVNKTPILGDLPIIGSLFRSSTRNQSRSEVLVLVTPNILDDTQQAGWGYYYMPGQNTQDMIQNRGFPVPRR